MDFDASGLPVGERDNTAQVRDVAAASAHHSLLSLFRLGLESFLLVANSWLLWLSMKKRRKKTTTQKHKHSMRRSFVVPCHSTASDLEVRLDDLNVNRVDLLARCVAATVFLAHGTRLGSELRLVLLGGIDGADDVEGAPSSSLSTSSSNDGDGDGNDGDVVDDASPSVAPTARAHRRARARRQQAEAFADKVGDLLACPLFLTCSLCSG